MPRPGRHIEGARTRERVLEAAADLIARQGYAATSIAQISQRSGSNPASIYWAFGSKEGLLAAVMERAADAFFAQLEPPREGDPTVLEAARRVRTKAADGLSAAFAVAFGITDPFLRRAVCDRLARFTLMLLDGVFVASQIESDTTDLRRAFETIALAVEAAGARLIADASRSERVGAASTNDEKNGERE